MKIHDGNAQQRTRIDRSQRMRRNHQLTAIFLLIGIFLGGCSFAPRPGTVAARRGDEIVVAGQFVHTGTRVVLWTDPGGYDAYRVERRFSAIDEAGWAASTAMVKDLKEPNRYGLRRANLTDEQLRAVRGGGWDLATVQQVVDQFVIHYDASGTSRQCFKVLHDHRGLSVHFLLDIDGTIYQTLDVKERAYHATISNHRSVGIEIANIGAYGVTSRHPLDSWYAHDTKGVRITLPAWLGDPPDAGVRTPNFIGRPARPEPVIGEIQGRTLVQYDFTPQQYEALIHLVASLCTVLPKIHCDYPRDAAGELIRHKLPDDELAQYQGLIGHYHIQTNKVDPGPAFDWDRVIVGARKRMARGFPPARE